MHAENLAKMQSLFKIVHKFLQIEKVGFHKKWHKTSRRCRKIDVLGEKLLLENIKRHKKQYEDSYAALVSSTQTDINKDPKAKNEAGLLYKEYRSNMEKERKTIEKSIRAFIKKASKKDPRFLDVGLCGNPIELGGCSAEDITQETLDWIVKHKKSKKIILKALR